MADLQVQVTNNTSAVIEVFDVRQAPIAPGGTVTATTPVTYTSLGTIAAGATGTITALHPSNHVVAMQTGALSDATELAQVNFPVKAIEFTSLTKDLSFTVEKADKDAMEQTFRFVRYVSANPGSTLATQFLAALGDKDPTTAVNAFFANSKSFSLCTKPTWAAVMSWQNQFLSAWQGTYFLYDASEQVKTITLVAGVTITLASGAVTGQIYLADPVLGNWTSSSQHEDLTIALGHVSELNPGQGGLAVDLQPVWMNEMQVTPTVTPGMTVSFNAKSVIAPTLSGTVNGKKVMGNFQKRSLPTSDTSSTNVGSAITAWLEKNINISVLISAGMLYFMYKQSQEAKPTRADKVIEDGEAKGKQPKDIADDVANDAKQADAEMQGPLQQQQADIQQKLNDLPKAEAAQQAAEKQVEVRDVIARQEARVDQILEEAPSSPAADDAVNALQSASDNVDAGKIDDAISDLGTAAQKIDVVATASESELSQEALDANKAVQEDIEEATKQREAEQQEEQEQEDQEERGSDDEFDPDDTSGPDPVDFPIGE